MSSLTEVEHHDFSNFVPFTIWLIDMRSVPPFLTTKSRNDQHLCGNLLAYAATFMEFAMLLSSFPGVPHTMSLYIDMKMILPWNCWGSHLNSTIIFWISPRIPNVVNPWTFSTRVLSALRRFDPNLWDSVSPDTIYFCLSRLELVLDWCLPNIAPSQKRRWFWIS